MDGWNTSFLLGWPIFRCELLVLGSVSRKELEGKMDGKSLHVTMNDSPENDFGQFYFELSKPDLG